MKAKKRGVKHFVLKGLLDIDPVTGCWIFLGRQLNGYGIIAKKNDKGQWVSTTAQHYFFELYRRKLNKGEEAAHNCHRRSCCNPRHLRAATHQNNVDDWKMDQKFTRGQKNEVARMLAADIPFSVIAELMCCPRPYIYRLARELEWKKYQTEFDFVLEDSA